MKTVLLSSVLGALVFSGTQAISTEVSTPQGEQGSDSFWTAQVGTEKPKLITAQKKTVSSEVDNGSGFLWDVKGLFKTGKCKGSLCKSIKKAVEESVDNPDGKGENLENAEQLLSHFSENGANIEDDMTSESEVFFRREKVIDALWYLGTGALKVPYDNSEKELIEKELVANLASEVNIDGPGSAAAYATWFSYKYTCEQGGCDPTLAMRVGMKAGAASLAFAENEGSTENEYADLEQVKKMIVGGALGGVSIAVSGGHEREIRNGFWKTAGKVLVRDRYKKITYNDEDERPAIEQVYCMNTANPSYGCTKDITTLTAESGEGSMGTNGQPKPITNEEKHIDAGIAESSNQMTESNEMFDQTPHEIRPNFDADADEPEIKTMSLFSGQWILDVKNRKGKRGPAASIFSSTPVAVLTYTGEEPFAYDLAQKKVKSADLSGTDKMIHEAIEVLEERSQKDVSFSGESVASSMLCIRGEKTRRIILESPSEEPGYACRVIHEWEVGVTVPWYARNQTNYCKSKAIALAVKQIGTGWTCYAQSRAEYPEYSKNITEN